MRILYAVVISETRREIAMEVPSSSQLSLLLQEDRAFRDYFNTFLRLPVREKTMHARLYISHTTVKIIFIADILQKILLQC